MIYTPDLIARVKGLMDAGIGPKLLSRISDIPYHTLREWDQELRRAEVKPDPQALDTLRGYIFASYTPAP